MSFGEAFGNLDGDGNGVAHCGDAASKEFTKSLSFDELEHQKVDAFMVPDVVEGADIGVGESGDSARFLFEPLAKIDILGKAFGQNLDSDNAAEASVASAIDLAHAACAERCHNFIRSEFCAWSEGHDLRDYNLGLGLPGKTLCRNSFHEKAGFATTRPLKKEIPAEQDTFDKQFQLLAGRART
jgi:hypothetical protein